ncbi:hypothetical protein CKQ79_29785, partial [Klebsiella pneumoniae]
IRNRCWDDKRSTRTMRFIPTARSSQVKLTDNEAPVVDPEIRNRCWDDKRSTRTMRFIPTARSSQVKLTDNEA